MNVNDFMTTRLESIDSEANVYNALELMVDRRIRSLLVQFPGGNKNNGVLTARDIVYKVLAQGRDPKEVPVAEIASRPISCISKDTPLMEAADSMKQAGVARLFVCDKEKIIGVISMMDFMSAMLIIRARGEHVF